MATCTSDRMCICTIAHVMHYSLFCCFRAQVKHGNRRKPYKTNTFNVILHHIKNLCFPCVLGWFCSRPARNCVGRPCRPGERGPQQDASLSNLMTAALPPAAQLDVRTRLCETHRFYWKFMHFPVVRADAHLLLAREPAARAL